MTASNSTLNLYAASRQWSDRPADERFASLEDLHAACTNFRAHAAEAKNVNTLDLKIVPVGAHDVGLVGGKGIVAAFTHWSFGQLCQRVGAPASYLRQLPAGLVVENLNHGLANATDRSGDDKKVNLLLHKNGGWHVNALTGTTYERIWNADVTKRLFALRDNGWKVPPARPAMEGQPGSRPATEADCIPQPGFWGEIKPGDIIAPAGLYASDHDMFAFMVQPDRIVSAGGANLMRGILVGNSEVGDKSWWMMRFLLNNVCGNHIIWGASDVMKIAVRHVGNANERAWSKMQAEITKYANSGTDEETIKIDKAARFLLGESKDEVLDTLFGINILSRKAIGAAYDLAVEHADTDCPGVSPNSAWGFVQGLTRLSQESHYADERTTIDAAGGKVMQMAF